MRSPAAELDSSPTWAGQVTGSLLSPPPRTLYFDSCAAAQRAEMHIISEKYQFCQNFAEFGEPANGLPPPPCFANHLSMAGAHAPPIFKFMWKCGNGKMVRKLWKAIPLEGAYFVHRQNLENFWKLRFQRSAVWPENKWLCFFLEFCWIRFGLDELPHLDQIFSLRPKFCQIFAIFYFILGVYLGDQTFLGVLHKRSLVFDQPYSKFLLCTPLSPRIRNFRPICKTL